MQGFGHVIFGGDLNSGYSKQIPDFHDNAGKFGHLETESGGHAMLTQRCINVDATSRRRL